MEAQIKEEAQETSLCFETSGDNVASLSLLEKYDKFIQNEDSELDSDGDFLPNDTILRQEYAQLIDEPATYHYPKDNRLSTGLSGKFNEANCFPSKSESGNGTTEGGCEPNGNTSQQRPSTVTRLNELIEKLKEVRKCEPDGNSIFCTKEELLAIQDGYAAILDLLHEESSSFERRSSSKDSENDEHVDVGNAASEDQREDMRRLAEKIASVQQARDRFYEVEQQVKEQIEQLELVERYKMESVG